MSFKSQSKSSDELIASDEQLKANTAFQALHAKYSKVASDADIAATVAGLEKNNHTAIVVATKDEALQAVLKLLPKGVTINNTGSTTLSQIGLVDYLTTSTDYDNLHAKVLAEKDMAKQGPLRRAALSADYTLTTVDAVTHDGHFAVSDASGTRVGSFTASGQLIIVIGANKIVKDDEEARDRLHNYTFPLESARVRAAYGWPSSAIANEIYVNTQLALLGKKFHFIIIKEQLGF